MSVIGLIFGMLVLLIVFGGSNYYITHRIWQAVETVRPDANRKIKTGVFVILVLLLVVGFVRSMLPLPGSVKNVIGAVSMYWMGIFVYLLLFFVIGDIVLFLGRVAKLIPAPLPSKVRLYSAVMVVVFTVMTVCYGLYNAGDTQKVSYEIEFSNRKLEGELNLILISDLHLGALGSEDRTEYAVSEINKMNADIVCIAGDIFDNDFHAVKNPEKMKECLKSIKSKYGVYACLGNHDAGKTVPQMEKFFEACNVNVLKEDYEVVDNRFIILGRTDRSPIGGGVDSERMKTDELLSGIDEELPLIVMDHNPADIDEYGDKADLIVSGHTHNGQLFPATIITELMYETDHGYYRESPGSPHVVVTSGLGTWGMPMRVGTNSEIIEIKIK